MGCGSWGGTGCLWEAPHSPPVLPPAPPQFHHLTWTCWDRLKVPAGQPERTLQSLLAHLQVCLPFPAPARPARPARPSGT